jgi:thiosulfate reductase cytochrome b subunit
MATRFQDRFTPTAVGLVSRAWVVEEVERRVADRARHAALIEELVGYEPPRQHALRNMFLFWAVAISASALAGALGLPRWSGFVVVVALFGWLARLLAIKALRWRLDGLLASDALSDAPAPDPRPNGSA